MQVRIHRRGLADSHLGAFEYMKLDGVGAVKVQRFYFIPGWCIIARTNKKG